MRTIEHRRFERIPYDVSVEMTPTVFTNHLNLIKNISGRTSDISLTGLGIRFDRPIEINGSEFFLISFSDKLFLVEIKAQVKHISSNGLQVGVEFSNPPRQLLEYILSNIKASSKDFV